MKSILIIGSGGREHALARAFLKSKHVGKVFVAPGNLGMKMDEITLVDISVTDAVSLIKFAKENSIDITFVGSEAPLDAGVVNAFRAEGLLAVGPTKEAARLESSKNFAKDVMNRAGVKNAKHRYFKVGEQEAATKFIEEMGLPFVIKADGLMAGKGVVIPSSMKEAKETLNEMMQDSNVVIEEFLVGREFSYFAFVNGEHIIPVGAACDYKRVGENDTGLNTGGMGAFAPVSWVDETLKQRVIDEVIKPVATQMVKDANPYTGVLYAGLILTKDGPKVIEFNARFGDPETQILLPLLNEDFYDIVMAHVNKKEFEITLKEGVNLGVVLASKGYPGEYEKGKNLTIPKEIWSSIYSAGMELVSGDEFKTAGGRVLMVTSHAQNIDECRDAVYKKVKLIKSENTFYRNDIGLHRDKI
ncbi:MAG: phosphoribosylamine--glycine ligase [Campylobacteraceae bacterium]|nr:phosphoribosylamine--glycine ligase [Campylobacteraceae bacterium]